MESVMKAAEHQIRLTGTLQNYWNRHKQSESYQKEKQSNDKEIRFIEEKIILLKARKQELYADMKEGILSFEDYEYEKKQLAEKQEMYVRRLKHINNTSFLETEINQSLSQQLQNAFSIVDSELTMDMLARLIDKIVVFSPERIEITYAFADEMKRWNEAL